MNQNQELNVLEEDGMEESAGVMKKLEFENEFERDSPETFGFRNPLENSSLLMKKPEEDEMMGIVRTPRSPPDSPPRVKRVWATKKKVK